MSISKIDQEDKGTNMKYLREKLDLSQEEMAQLLQISRRTLASCEAGQTEPKLTIEVVQRFSDLVKSVTCVDILSIPGFRLSSSEGQTIFEHYEKLIEKKRLDLLTNVQKMHTIKNTFCVEKHRSQDEQQNFKTQGTQASV